MIDLHAANIRSIPECSCKSLCWFKIDVLEVVRLRESVLWHEGKAAQERHMVDTLRTSRSRVPVLLKVRLYR